MLDLYLKYWALHALVGHPVGIYCAIVCTGVIWFSADEYFSMRMRRDGLPEDAAATATWVVALTAFALWWFTVPFVCYLAASWLLQEIALTVLRSLGRTFDWFVLRPLRPPSRRLWRRLRQPQPVKEDPIPRAKVVSR